MEYRKLGSTGIEVSEIAFGAEFLVERPYEDTEELIKACEENGINFVDCWMIKLPRLVEAVDLEEAFSHKSTNLIDLGIMPMLPKNNFL